MVFLCHNKWAALEGAYKHDVEVAGLFLPFALEAEVVRFRFAVLAVAIRLETYTHTSVLSADVKHNGGIQNGGQTDRARQSISRRAGAWCTRRR